MFPGVLGTGCAKLKSGVFVTACYHCLTDWGFKIKDMKGMEGKGKWKGKGRIAKLRFRKSFKNVREIRHSRKVKS